MWPSLQAGSSPSPQGLQAEAGALSGHTRSRSRVNLGWKGPGTPAVRGGPGRRLPFCRPVVRFVFGEHGDRFLVGSVPSGGSKGKPKYCWKSQRTSLRAGTGLGERDVEARGFHGSW